MSFQELRNQGVVFGLLVGATFGLSGCGLTEAQIAEYNDQAKTGLNSAKSTERDLNLCFESRASDLNKASYIAIARESGDRFLVVLNREIPEQNSLANQIDSAILKKDAFSGAAGFDLDSDAVVPVHVRYKDFLVQEIRTNSYGETYKMSYYKVEKLELTR